MKTYKLSIVFFAFIFISVLVYWFSVNMKSAAPEFTQSQVFANSVHELPSAIKQPKRASALFESVVGTKREHAETKLVVDSAERLAWARDAVHSGDPAKKLQALQLLINIAPAEATEILRALILRLKTDPAAVQLLTHGIMGMANAKNYLLDRDLKYIFETSDGELKKKSAMILAARGDESFVKNYIELISVNLQNESAYERAKTLREMLTLGSISVVPYALSSLTDPDAHVKFDALTLLAQLGNKNNISDVAVLLKDEDQFVSQQAQQTMDVLRERNVDEQSALSKGFAPLEKYAEGFIPGEEEGADKNTEVNEEGHIEQPYLNEVWSPLNMR